MKSYIINQRNCSLVNFEAHLVCEVKAFMIRAKRHAEIPTVTHIDASGRLKFYKDVAPRYHALFSACNNKIWIPIVLNPNFNENETIFKVPEHALACYLRTSMDTLVLGN